MRVYRIDPEYMDPETNVFERDLGNMGTEIGRNDNGNRVMIMYGDHQLISYIHIVEERTGERITIHFD